MNAFANGFAWVVAVLSGLATLFALFGGQQWLDERGWTLSPSTSAETSAPEPDGETATATETATDDSASLSPADNDDGESLSAGAEGLWAAMTDWSESTFDNLFWGIAATGLAMFLAGTVGYLFALLAYWVYAAVAFFQVISALVLTSTIVVAGFLLHSADPGHLLWFVILTGVSVPMGYLIGDDFFA